MDCILFRLCTRIQLQICVNPKIGTILKTTLKKALVIAGILTGIAAGAYVLY